MLGDDNHVLFDVLLSYSIPNLSATMNYVDTIDLPGANTPPANAEDPPGQSLNEEVNEVLGQLNSFWGGFRKQVCLALVCRGKLRHFDDAGLAYLRVR